MHVGVRPQPGRALLLLLLAAVAALALAVPAHGGVVVGIADQKTDLFDDPRFQRLEINHARIYVPWDVRTVDAQVAQLDRWMARAWQAGVWPLVSFGHSRVDRRSLPTPRRMQREFEWFRQRYPWVLNFATWNEANHCGEPTCHRARLVAAYWRGMTRSCPRCRVLAAEVLDMPNMVRWVREFRRWSGSEPKWWGLHNYVEANRFKTASLRRLLRTVRGRIWITETGGLVWRRNGSRTRLRGSSRHAARVTRFLFREVLPLSPRISRLYLYHWNIDRPRDKWDSALIGGSGQARPALRVLQRELERLRLQARRAEARRAKARRR